MATRKRAPAKKTTGRPTKYCAAIQKKAEHYVESGFEDLEHVVPSRSGLALTLKVTRETLIDWGKKNPVFSDTLKDLDKKQELLALGGGLLNKFNPTIVKLLLANHGYSEKQQVDNISSDGTMTPPGKIELVAYDGSANGKG